MKKQYVDVQKHWKKLKSYARSADATKIWKRDLKKYHTAFRVYGPHLNNKTLDRDWFDRIVPFEKYHESEIPADFDLSSWRYDNYRRGRKPAYWDYVVAGKCHWLVNLNLFLAQKAFPKEAWRIISSSEHSCVWNGKNLLFDMNYLVLVPDVTRHPFYEKFDKDVKILSVGEEFIFRITDIDVRVLDGYDAGIYSFAAMHDYFFECVEEPEST